MAAEAAGYPIEAAWAVHSLMVGVPQAGKLPAGASVARRGQNTRMPIASLSAEKSGEFRTLFNVSSGRVFPVERRLCTVLRLNP